MLQKDLILICNLIEEAVTVNGQLVDNLLNHWLHLEVCKDTATNILVQNLKTDAYELLTRHTAIIAVIKEGSDNTDVLERDVFDKFVANCVELCSS